MTRQTLNISDVEKIHVNIDDVYLDINNPRFYGEADFDLPSAHDVFDQKNQEIVRQYILKKYAAREIVESILEVGFIPVDLIILEEVEHKYIVIEGNRRVTALKTIIGDYHRKEISVDKNILNSITNFEALKIKNTDVNFEKKKWILQGIRHVSGIRGWGPYQQAMLIHELYYKHDMTFADIGKTIGIHYNRVSTMLRAYLSLVQMKNNEKYSKHSHVNLFSHFEQAYIKKQIREWLEWDDKQRKYTNFENLEKFYDLIITENKDSIVTSKNIRDDLPIIFENTELFESVMSKRTTLSQALEKIDGYNDTITGSIKSCLEIVRSAATEGQLRDEDRKLLAEMITILTA